MVQGILHVLVNNDVKLRAWPQEKEKENPTYRLQLKNMGRKNIGKQKREGAHHQGRVSCLLCFL